MTPAPRPSLPKGNSPIRALRPEVETVFTAPQESVTPQSITQAEPAQQGSPAVITPSSGQVPASSPQDSSATPPSTAAAVPTPTAPTTPAAPTQPDIDWDEKKVTTLRVRRGLKAQAETAVLRTQKLEGGHKSWVALVDEALRRELERLANEFNGGVPFEPNTSEFQTGRLPGS